eukprot:scaffold219787_cov22-Tisochrysis_lutea.AAC.1
MGPPQRRTTAFLTSFQMVCCTKAAEASWLADGRFPTELLTAILAGRWAANYSPYRPFIVGYGLRLVVSLNARAYFQFLFGHLMGISKRTELTDEIKCSMPMQHTRQHTRVAAVSILAARDFPSKAALDDESWSSGGHTSYGVSLGWSGRYQSSATWMVLL